MTAWLLLALLVLAMVLVTAAAVAFGTEAGPPAEARHRCDQDHRKP